MYIVRARAKGRRGNILYEGLCQYDIWKLIEQYDMDLERMVIEWHEDVPALDDDVDVVDIFRKKVGVCGLNHGGD